MAGQADNRIAKLDEQHKVFIPVDKDISHKFWLRTFYPVQVPAGQLWQIYRDGVFYEQLKAGRHYLWSAFWHTWYVHEINIRTVTIPFTFEGRVRGPIMPSEARSAAGVDLGCSVEAEVRLSCKIADAQRFLEYEEPLSVFYASLLNMVVEMISKLPYDQFGDWATTLRDEMRERLQGGRDDSELLIGMRVEQVYVTDVKPNSLQDRSMVAMYQQVERVRRELAEAQANKERDAENARSFAEQGNILNIAPSILALQNSPIGKELLARDADLRKMMVAAGINPGVSVQAIRDPQGQIGTGAASSAAYLNLPQQANGGMGATNPLLGPAVSGSLAQGGQSSPPWSTPTESLATNTSSLDSSLVERELAALQAAGFQCAGRGQFVPTYDRGLPIPGTTEWMLEVYVQRINGFITVVFSCPTAYPSVPPRVQMRTPTNSVLRVVTPNAVHAWTPTSTLADIVRELDNNTQ